MATHSSVLAWRIPGTGEPDGLPSMGKHRAGHDWSDLAAAAVTLNNYLCYELYVETNELMKTERDNGLNGDNFTSKTNHLKKTTLKKLLQV